MASYRHRKAPEMGPFNASQEAHNDSDRDGNDYELINEDLCELCDNYALEDFTLCFKCKCKEPECDLYYKDCEDHKKCKSCRKTKVVNEEEICFDCVDDIARKNDRVSYAVLCLDYEPLRARYAQSTFHDTVRHVPSSSSPEWPSVEPDPFYDVPVEVPSRDFLAKEIMETDPNMMQIVEVIPPPAEEVVKVLEQCTDEIRLHPDSGYIRNLAEQYYEKFAALTLNDAKEKDKVLNSDGEIIKKMKQEEAERLSYEKAKVVMERSEELIRKKRSIEEYKKSDPSFGKESRYDPKGLLGKEL
jgi:hypothetical protein